MVVEETRDKLHLLIMKNCAVGFASACRFGHNVSCSVIRTSESAQQDWIFGRDLRLDVVHQVLNRHPSLLKTRFFDEIPHVLNHIFDLFGRPWERDRCCYSQAFWLDG